MADTTQFRAALHGYNREDVVDYIDRMTKEHEETVQLLQKSVAKLREELAEANDALAIAKKNHGSDQDPIETQTLIANLRKHNEELKLRVESQSEELEQLRKAHESEESAALMDREEELERLRTENTELHSELDRANEALAAAKGDANAEKELADAQFLIGELRSSDEAQKNRIQSLEAELGQIRTAWKDELASVNQTHEDELKTLRQENSGLRGEVTTLSEALSAARENTDAENELLKAKLKNEDLLIRTENLESQTQSLQQELEKAKQANETLKMQTQALQAELEAAQANEALEEQVRALQAELEAAQANEALEEQVRALQAELEAAQENEALEEEQVRTLQAELEEARANAAKLAATAQESAAASEHNRSYEELELAAYRRAEQTERLARDRAEDVYRQVQSVFGQANEQMGSYHADLEQLCQTLAANVDEMRAVLDKLNGAYRQTELSFAEIGAKDRQRLEDKI